MVYYKNLFDKKSLKITIRERKKMRLIIALFTILFITGCQTVVKELPATVVAQEATTQSHKICRNLLVALMENNADKFTSYLSPDARENFNAEEFKRSLESVTKTLGTPISFTYLTTLDFPILVPHIWKIRFCKKLKKDDKIQNVYSEALFRIITGRSTDNSIFVIGFNFL